ncbi:MAG: DUF58 domain-containing protein [Myxococcales bacterium]|nr:DUF58 domain-containing protein [Myxococcales bacterium]
MPEPDDSPEDDPLKAILRRVRRIELITRGKVKEKLGGEYHSSFKGQGIDFDDFREYQAGDEVRAIDWNVTARMGEPFVKVFREERELTVMLVVDKSGSEAFGSALQTKKELIAEVSALIAFSAISNNDRVGAILFTDTVEKFIPPKKGKKHVLRLIRDLLHFEPQGKATDVGAALEFLNRVATRKSLVFLISDFIAEGYARSLNQTARRHDLIAVNVSDPLERAMPAAQGLLWLEDLETGEPFVLDTASEAFRRYYGDRRAASQESRRREFARRRIDQIDISTDADYVPRLVDFFRKRSRRRSQGR